MRLLVVDDEADFVEAVARGLRREGYAVDVAGDGATAWMALAIDPYDVLILDLNLPGMDGVDLCRQVRSVQPALLILVLTARSHPAERILGLDSGADDYLVKPFHFGELVARIRALLRRDIHARHAVLSYKDLHIDTVEKCVWKGDRRLDLTMKEWALLDYLVHHPGEVISQEHLLEHVWDRNANPLTTTVRVHINSLRRKLGDAPDRCPYITTVIGGGYQLASPHESESRP